MSKRTFYEKNRGKPTREIRKIIYISCEGKTEKTYFDALNSLYQNVVIKTKHGSETSAPAVVRNFKKFFADEIEKDDFRYCVFDCDKNSEQQLFDAKILAKEIKINILFSNPCFELWYCWHFSSSCKNTNAHELKNFLKEQQGFNDYKNNIDIEKLMTIFYKASETAKQQVKALTNSGIQLYSRKSNPHTNVFEIFEQLL